MFAHVLNRCLLLMLLMSLAGCNDDTTMTKTKAAATAKSVNHSETSFPFKISDLYVQMGAKGVSPSSVSRVRVLNDESGGVGAFDIPDPEDVDTIWRSIAISYPYDIWSASGYRQLAFYTPSSKESPALILYVNKTDGCWIHGYTNPDDSPRRFRCLGLHEFIMNIGRAGRGRFQKDANVPSRHPRS